jgi:ribonuclease P protein component
MLNSLSGASRFQAVLSTRPCARSEHFFVHHLADGQLSTEGARTDGAPVDGGLSWRLGLVVPKRHAKRSVTRTLVKREMRAGMARLASGWPAGDWVVRLRAPIDRTAYPSARSDALMLAVRGELGQVLADALRRAGAGRVSRPADATAVGVGSAR